MGSEIIFHLAENFLSFSSEELIGWMREAEGFNCSPFFRVCLLIFAYFFFLYVLWDGKWDEVAGTCGRLRGWICEYVIKEGEGKKRKQSSIFFSVKNLKMYVNWKKIRRRKKKENETKTRNKIIIMYRKNLHIWTCVEKIKEGKWKWMDIFSRWYDFLSVIEKKRKKIMFKKNWKGEILKNLRNKFLLKQFLFFFQRNFLLWKWSKKFFFQYFSGFFSFFVILLAFFTYIRIFKNFFESTVTAQAVFCDVSWQFVFVLFGFLKRFLINDLDFSVFFF